MCKLMAVLDNLNNLDQKVSRNPQKSSTLLQHLSVQTPSGNVHACLQRQGNKSEMWETRRIFWLPFTSAPSEVIDVIQGQQRD